MRKTTVQFLAISLAALMVTGCSDSTSSDDDCAVGSEACKCTSGGACDPGLSCLSNLCVNTQGSSTSTDATGATNGTDGISATSGSTASDGTASDGTDGATGEVKSGLNENCQKTADCQSGLKCIKKECQTDSDTTEGCSLLGGQWFDKVEICIIKCGVDDQCPGSKKCQEGICVEGGCNSGSATLCGHSSFFYCHSNECRVRCDDNGKCPLTGAYKCKDAFLGTQYCAKF